MNNVLCAVHIMGQAGSSEHIRVIWVNQTCCLMIQRTFEFFKFFITVCADTVMFGTGLSAVLNRTNLT